MSSSTVVSLSISIVNSFPVVGLMMRVINIALFVALNGNLNMIGSIGRWKWKNFLLYQIYSRMAQDPPRKVTGLRIGN